jgi:hypothetical protein
MAKLYSSLYERLIANTILANEDDPNSCWLWTGHICADNGYPRLAIRVPGKRTPRNIAAHRAMLEEFYDIEFPFDEAGHLCGVPRCINPLHLEVQTPAMNKLLRGGIFTGCTGPKLEAACMIPTLFPRAGSGDDPPFEELGTVAASGDDPPF